MGVSSEIVKNNRPLNVFATESFLKTNKMETWALPKIIVVPSHYKWVPDYGRKFVTAYAMKAEGDASECTGCRLCCGNIARPRAQDYDINNVTYVLPAGADPITALPMNRQRHVPYTGCGACFTCGQFAVPKYANRRKMYPHLFPKRQSMLPAAPIAGPQSTDALEGTPAPSAPGAEMEVYGDEGH